MIADNYYEITSLPALGELSSAPPLTLRQFLARLENNPSAYGIVETLVLHDDLLERQGFLSGEIKEVKPTVLTAAQIRNEEPLPEYLAIRQESTRPIETDDIWDNYFRYAIKIAQRFKSEFLRTWVGFEVALRNALVVERSQALGLEPQFYLVAEDLQSDEEDFSSLINDWRSAQTPLVGLQILLKHKWNWINKNDPYFTFGTDELAVYCLRLMLLTRWYRLTQYRSDDKNAQSEQIERNQQ